MSCGGNCSCKTDEIKFRHTFSYDDLALVPSYSEIDSRSQIDVSTGLLNRDGTSLKLRLPLISSPMDSVTEVKMAIALGKLGGLGIIHRFMSVEEQANQVRQVKAEGLLAAAAVGAKEEDGPRIAKLMSEGVDLICVDIAHGHHKMCRETIQRIRDINMSDEYPQYVHVMAGSVCTKVGTFDLIQWGADSVRCGISNGSLCSTAVNTAAGVPQVTAILDCYSVAGPKNIPVIADGGVRVAGDVVKALGLGASAVMLGSLFSGTDESPGSLKKVGSFGNEILMKTYRGSASLDSKIARGESNKNVEGAATLVPYKGPVENVVNSLIDGLRSGMSYAGARNLDQFCPQFVQVSSAGHIESTPHLLRRSEKI